MHNFLFLPHKNAQNCKFSNKNDLLCAWRDFIKTFCDVCTYHRWNFKPKISKYKLHAVDPSTNVMKLTIENKQCSLIVRDYIPTQKVVIRD